MTPQQENEPANCPFCDTTPIIDGKDEYLRIRCETCGVQGPILDFNQESDEEIAQAERDAIAAWNRRAPAPTEAAVDRDAASIRDHADFREDIESLSTQKHKPTLKRIRKEIYDTIDRRVANAVAVALATPASPAVPDDSSMPVDMSQAKRWIVQLRGRVDSLLAIINAQAVPEPAPLAPYDALFKAIAAGTVIAGNAVSVSVKAFTAELAKQGYTVAPQVAQASQPTPDPKGGVDVDDVIRELGVEDEVARIRAEQFSQPISAEGKDSERLEGGAA